MNPIYCRHCKRKTNSTNVSIKGNHAKGICTVCKNSKSSFISKKGAGYFTDFAKNVKNDFKKDLKVNLKKNSIKTGDRFIDDKARVKIANANKKWGWLVGDKYIRKKGNTKVANYKRDMRKVIEKLL